jgi:hypothetical protein
VIESLPPLVAPLANLVALLLALAFRRNRAVLLLLVIALAAAALAGYPVLIAGRPDAALMFAPWLLLAGAAMPERGLLARRNLLLLFATSVAVWLTFAAPPHVWSSLHAALPLGALPWSANAVAAVLVVAAAGLCVLRRVLRGVLSQTGRVPLRRLCEAFRTVRPLRVVTPRLGRASAVIASAASFFRTGSHLPSRLTLDRRRMNLIEFCSGSVGLSGPWSFSGFGFPIQHPVHDRDQEEGE